MNGLNPLSLSPSMPIRYATTGKQQRWWEAGKCTALQVRVYSNWKLTTLSRGDAVFGSKLPSNVGGGGAGAVYSALSGGSKLYVCSPSKRVGEGV